MVSSRLNFIDIALGAILNSFYGTHSEIASSNHGRRKDMKITAEQASFLRGKGLSAEELKDVDRRWHDRKPNLQEQCTYCSRYSSQVQTSERFKVCKKCSDIGRTVRYCSRCVICRLRVILPPRANCTCSGSECQVNDWKKGDPPHRITCGKPTSDLPDLASTPYSFAGTPLSDRTKAQGIPLPKEGFVRSPALQYQIQLLLENPELDYCLIGWHARAHKSDLVLLDTLQKQLVRQARNTAFYDGDRNSVQYLYHVLKSTVGPEVGLDNVKRQLQAEYGFEIEEDYKFLRSEDDESDHEETTGYPDSAQRSLFGDCSDATVNLGGSLDSNQRARLWSVADIRAEQSLNALAQGIPSPKAGYVRPLGLRLQIDLLCSHPEIDYFLNRAQTDDHFDFILDDPKDKQYWRYMRNEAFETGDPAMARRMYRWVANAAKHEVKEADLQRQWFVEYGVDVKDITDAGPESQGEMPQ